jgi:excisionase family DNA binding protein
MAVRHLFTTSAHSGARSPGKLGASRRFGGVSAYLWFMTNDSPDPAGVEPILSLPELASRLGVTAQTIYDLRNQGRGPRGFRLGRHLRFRASEVDASLAVAVLLDATLVRTILVPSVMTSLERVLWWAPRWMRPIHTRFGLHE